MGLIISPMDRGPVSAPPPVPFSPSDIAGLKLWLKADSLSLNDGDAITSWTDSSGSGNNGSGGAFGNATYKTAIQNGLPIARFDGSVSGVDTAAPVSAQPVTVLIVASQTSKATLGPLFTTIGSPAYFMKLTTSGFFNMRAGSNTLADTTDHSGAFHVYTGVFNGASSFGYVDGSQVVTGDAGTFPTSGGVHRFGYGSFLTGDEGEILFYDSALSSTNRGLVEAYLKTKWGTP